MPSASTTTSPTLAARVLGACRIPELWRWPIPESLHGLRQLHDHGIPLGVVSNASGQIAETLCRAGICQVGDGDGVAVRCVIDSYVVGVAKPDPAIFDHAALEFGGIDRSRIVYVGDSVTIDVAAATAAGLRPVLLDPYDDHVGAPFERIRDGRRPARIARETVEQIACNCYKVGTLQPMKKLLALSAVGVLAFAACGDDDDDDGGDTTVPEAVATRRHRRGRADAEADVTDAVEDAESRRHRRGRATPRKPSPSTTGG